MHYFGTATLSYSDEIQCEAGDVFEIEAPLAAGQTVAFCCTPLSL